jgi:hypothetical protein
MKLSVKDRLFMPLLLLKNYNLIDGLTKKHIVDKIAFNEKEIEDLHFVNHEDGRVTWDAKAAIDTEIPFTHAQVEFLKRSVKALSDQQLITDETFSLCERIDAL